MADLTAFLGAQRTAFDGKVLRIHGDFTPIDLAESGDDGGPGIAVVDIAAAEPADLFKGTGVEQQIKAFARSVLMLGVLLGASTLLGVPGQFRGLGHGRAQRLPGLCLGGGDFENVAHCLPPFTSNVTSVSPASTPFAGPTKIFFTVPAAGAYT